MTDIRQVWTRLGFMFAAPPSDFAPNPESAIVAALLHVRDDARLFAGVATWLHRYGGLVDGRRLVRELEDADPSPPSALLGALITASRSAALRGLAKHCTPQKDEQILFSVMESNAALREKVSSDALPEFRRWGFLLDHFSLKLDALRPPSWVLRMNPALQMRAVIGPGLMADAVAHLTRNEKTPSISELARELGRSYAAVHAAVGALQARGIIETRKRGRSNDVHVPRDVADWLAAYPAVLPPGRRDRSVGFGRD